jgi:NitT/TauT family transport system ATP-binding protein
MQRRNKMKQFVTALLFVAVWAIFVTHNIQESIYLADRVVVMTYRPGTVKKIVPVGFPHPRDMASPSFISLQQELTDMVMEEQMRSQKAETAVASAD